jgi:hypothetical protein
MNLSKLIGTYGLSVFSPPLDGELAITFGYASDLLSDVIANAGKGCVWITMQTHVNIIAVAALKDVGAIVIVSNHKPADETITTAKQKGVCLLSTGMSTFEICGRLYTAGIRAEGG